MTTKQSIKPLPGTLHLQMVSCSRQWCNCSRGGPRHGPYAYRYYRRGGRQHRQYVRLAEVEQVEEATRLWKTLHPPMSRLLASLEELGDLHRILTQEVDVEK